MRFLAILPFVCAVASFVLALLCLFAGSSPGYLENADMLTLNTSMLGANTINTTHSGSSSSNPLISFLANATSTIEGDINGLIHDAAESLDIHDFYSMHMMDFCEGYYTPSAVTNATSSPSKNVTSCSNRTALYTFDPTSILQSELRTGISLQDIKWPSSLTDAINVLQAATRATFILYCIGIGFAGIAIIGALVGFVFGGGLNAMINAMISFLAFLTLGIASAIATAVIVKTVAAVNQYGNDIGIAAYQGGTFLTYTWVSTALMLIAMILWFTEFGLLRRQQIVFVRNGKEGRM